MRINRPGQSERGAGWLTITVLLFLYVDAAAATSVPEESSLRVPSRDIRERKKQGSDSHWDSHKVQKSGLLKDLDNIGMDTT